MKKMGGADSLVSSVNAAVRDFKKRSYRLDRSAIDRLVSSVDKSIEKKKNDLMRALHDSVIQTFSINLGKITKEELQKEIGENILALRNIVRKLIAINYYLSTSFSEEADLPERPGPVLSRKDWQKLESRICHFIDKIIILDNRLLKNYRQKQDKAEKEEKKDFRELTRILKRQKELLYHMEAKLPPKVSSRLIQKPKIDYWISTVLALLDAIESEYDDELKIFMHLKKDKLLKKKINLKVRHLMKEKTEALKLKEGRILMSDELQQMDKDWKKHIRDWMAASEL